MSWNFKKIALIFCFCGLALPTLWLPLNIAKADEAALEIVYPEIPGVPRPEVVSSGLPEYIRYIFWFAVAIIGLVVLGAFIYSGFEYLTSFGNPEKFTSGKKGMLSAGFGAIILLSAYLIFNTINPQLTILNMPDPTVLAPIVYPGIYLCNHKVNNISDIISRYMADDEDIKINAARELRDIMMDKSGAKQCARIEGSGNLKNPFNRDEHTMFMIPRKEYVVTPATETTATKTEIVWQYDYGVIFHEKDNSRGKCRLKSLYNVEPATPIGSDFTKANSVTLFTKPDSEPSSDRKGVVLYQCKDFNNPTLCPKEVNNPARASFPTTMPMGWFDRVEKKDLVGENENPGDLAQNTYSIQIDPEGSYFSVLFSEDNFKGDPCEIISESDPDLTNNPIGQRDCPGWGWNDNNCSYLQSMVVIKGKVL